MTKNSKDCKSKKMHGKLHENAFLLAFFGPKYPKKANKKA